MIKKICATCGNTYPITTQCQCQVTRHKYYDKYQRNKAATSFYHSPEWQAVAQEVKTAAYGLDEYTLHTNKKMMTGRIAHHIYPLEECKQYALNKNYLIYVSTKTHAMIHAAYDKSAESKREMQRKLLKIVGLR